jgi:uncharacterized protein with PIN domain
MAEDKGPRFACDAMLGGLARWLRAAGYDACWHGGVADPELVRLARVLRGLGLPLRDPRCMACGGELAELTRQEAAGRVPPRSLARHDRFWECVRCGRAFWHGTHWENIIQRLRQAAP